MVQPIWTHSLWSPAMVQYDILRTTIMTRSVTPSICDFPKKYMNGHISIPSIIASNKIILERADLSYIDFAATTPSSIYSTDHTKENNHEGGVQGAFFNLLYHSFLFPEFVIYA